MEDTLGASLSGSFAPPTTAQPHKPATEAGTTQSSGAVAAEPEAESASIFVPGMDEWKTTLESYDAAWKKDADELRARAEKNRKFYEDEAEAKTKAAKDEEALKKRREREEKRAEEGRERLRRELAGEVKPRKGGKGDEKAKVKEAWEMVASEAGQSEGLKGKEVVTDGRGVMPQDIRAGQAHAQGEPRPTPKQTMYDPTTSTEPLPPSMLPPTKPRGPTSHPSESQAASRHSATSQAWEEISASPSSAEDISPASSGTGSGFTSSPGQEVHAAPLSNKGASLPNSSDPEKQSKDLSVSQFSGGAPPAPTQPPSLTLSLFTSPANLSVTRVIAVLGINLLLPFINGVMLGFGEIFARETVKFGRLVWRGERALFGRAGWGDAEGGQARGGGRGVAGVGLSGSGGFP